MYRLLIFASFLTLRNESKIILCFKRCPKNCCLTHMRRKLLNFGGGGGVESQRCQLQYLWRDIAKMYIHACMRTHINVHMKTHVHAPKCSYSHACMHACTHICMHACICRYIKTIIYLHSYMKIKASALYDKELENRMCRLAEQKSNKENLLNIFSR